MNLLALVWEKHLLLNEFPGIIWVGAVFLIAFFPFCTLNCHFMLFWSNQFLLKSLLLTPLVVP